MVLHLIVWLVTTLLYFDSETGSNVTTFCFSSDLVSAIAGIQTARGENALRILNSNACNWHKARCNPRTLHTSETPGLQTNLPWRHVRYTLSDPKRLRRALRARKSRLKRICNRVIRTRQRLAKLYKKRFLQFSKQYNFDSTLGFPGEGWQQFSVATWNTRSLTRERFEYAKSLGYDALALTELWRNQGKYQTRSKQFIVSTPKLKTSGPNKGTKRFPDDRAAGVGILLSDRMQKKVHSFGSEGERVCWVRLQGPVCNLFVVAVYLPHRGRIAPAQDQTLTDLQRVLSNVPARDCVCLLGDFNEQLPAGVDGITGAWTGGPPTKNADKIVELLRLNNLTAVNTMYRPKKNSSVHTFLKTKRKANDDGDELQQFVGRTAKCKYKGRWIKGTVIAPSLIAPEPAWIVRYADGYHKTYTEPQLCKLLVHETPAKDGHQIDYLFVSRRWVSCVRQCAVRWAPAKHRNLHGDKDDHGLLASTWKWRIRTAKISPTKDFNKLSSSKDILSSFSKAVTAKLDEISTAQMSTTKLYNCIDTAIKHAIETTLPDITRGKSTHRTVSTRTKSLFEKRTKMKRCNQGQYDDLQKEIRASSMRDFHAWVEEHANRMCIANGKGNTSAIYDSVKALAGKQQRPPKNLTSNGQGKLLRSATEVAARWYDFLSDKFAATPAERSRPEMEALPPTVGQGELTEEEILQGLAKMKLGKTTGPDTIPIIVFKTCPVCKRLLVRLLQQIWRDEAVPQKFGEAKFVMLYKCKGSADDPSKYRCLGMLNHCYKVLSQCMLARITTETETFLSDWQAGFRSKRGCRDNVLILRTL